MSFLVRFLLLGKKFSSIGVGLVRNFRLLQSSGKEINKLPPVEKKREIREIYFPILRKLKEPTDKKVRYFMIWFVSGCGVATASGFLWINNREVVPITGRHHTVLFSKETELLLKKYVLKSLGYKERHPVITSNNGEEVTILTDTINGHIILHDENDSRVRLVTTVVDHLKRACIYFSPESEDYFNNFSFTLLMIQIQSMLFLLWEE